VFRHVRHLRGLLAAFAVLALTAGIALAGRPATMPSAAADGLATAGAAAGKIVPVVVEEEAPAPADEDADEDVPADAEADDAANHGALVSEAAQAATPEGFDNHGQYVKSVATANHGQETAKEAREAAAARGGSDKAPKTKPTR
jgi:hypothetical protein